MHPLLSIMGPTFSPLLLPVSLLFLLLFHLFLPLFPYNLQISKANQRARLVHERNSIRGLPLAMATFGFAYFWRHSNETSADRSGQFTIYMGMSGSGRIWRWGNRKCREQNVTVKM